MTTVVHLVLLPLLVAVTQKGALSLVRLALSHPTIRKHSTASPIKIVL